MQLSEKQKFQRYNWIIRPIQEEALQYAIDDVLYLLPLKDKLLSRIYENKLFDSFMLRNMQVQSIEFTSDPEKKYKNISGYSRLDQKEQAVFQRVYDVRQEYAEMYNLPAYRIIRNDDLIKIAKDKNHLNRIQFPVDLSVDGIRQLLKELRTAVT